MWKEYKVSFHYQNSPRSTEKSLFLFPSLLGRCEGSKHLVAQSCFLVTVDTWKSIWMIRHQVCYFTGQDPIDQNKRSERREGRDQESVA